MAYVIEADPQARRRFFEEQNFMLSLLAHPSEPGQETNYWAVVGGESSILCQAFSNVRGIDYAKQSLVAKVFKEHIDRSVSFLGSKSDQAFITRYESDCLNADFNTLWVGHHYALSSDSMIFQIGSGSQPVASLPKDQLAYLRLKRDSFSQSELDTIALEAVDAAQALAYGYLIYPSELESTLIAGVDPEELDFVRQVNRSLAGYSHEERLTYNDHQEYNNPFMGQIHELALIALRCKPDLDHPLTNLFNGFGYVDRFNPDFEPIHGRWNRCYLCKTDHPKEKEGYLTPAQILVENQVLDHLLGETIQLLITNRRNLGIQFGSMVGPRNGHKSLDYLKTIAV